MDNGDIATLIAATAAGLVGLALFIFLGYMAVSFMRNARPAGEFGSREDYPMDGGIHKPQMGSQNADEEHPN